MAVALGIDLGTGTVRVGAFDAATGAEVASAEGDYETRFPAPGWAEQDPDAWWRALCAATRRVLDQLGETTVVSIGVATTASTVVVAREDGTVLRPALLWMDCRAHAEAAATGRSRHRLMAYSGHSDAAEWLVPKSMWLKRHEPDVYAAADRIVEALDWLVFRLTGRWVASRMNATCKWNLDPRTLTLPLDLYEEFGIVDLAPKLPKTVLPVGAPVGEVSAAAAADLGLKNRPLVGQGGIDAHTGMVAAGALAPARMLLIGGTSAVHLIHTAREVDTPGIWGPYPDALAPGCWLLEGGQVTAGAVLDWLVRILGRQGADVSALIDAASRRPVGGTGLLVLDYWMGNRTPYRDAQLRGGMFGFSMDHDEVDLYRACVEGIALGSANVVAAMRDAGVPIDHVVAAGGIRRNPLWLRATTDAIGVPMELSPQENMSMAGAAAAGAAAALFDGDLSAAERLFYRPGRVIEPDPASHAIYRELLGHYVSATETLAPTLHYLSSSRQQRVANGSALEEVL